MSQYSFKNITTVHTGDEFNNIMLSRTNRKTPTVIRRHYCIARIRKFYMMKVKFITLQYTERFTMILDQFPKIDSLHPFYAELLNTNYNKEHYKIALGQVNAISHKISKLAADYIKLMKYADSLFRCKSLKRIAMGRMVKMVKRNSSVFVFLEEVRQHLSRLPSIDPEEKTLLLCGCPNAGKSSFMNLVTRAEVEVQPYAFTTKSIYVGHMDFKYSRWQVIDTPGILDRPLEDMNTIELQAVTALTHTKSSVLFFIDISELCGMSIENQLKTFHALYPLFEKQPKYIVCNKCDVITLERLKSEQPEKYAHIAEIERKGVKVFEISTLHKQGVMELKNSACEFQLSERVDQKLRGKKVESVLNRVYVAKPKSDGVERPVFIPSKIMENKKEKKFITKITDTDPNAVLELNIETEQGDDYVVDYCKNKDLEKEEWKYDKIPRFWNGKNIPDFITEDIVEKYEVLMDDEKDREKVGFYDTPEWTETEQDSDFRELAQKIRDQKIINRENAIADGTGKGVRPIQRESRPRARERNTTDMRTKFEKLGVSMENSKDAAFTQTSEKRGRSESRAPFELPAKKQRTGLAASRARSASKPRRDEAGIPDPERRAKLKALAKKALKAKQARGHVAESDRHVYNLMPKHLFSGKRGIGKAQRR